MPFECCFPLQQPLWWGMLQPAWSKSLINAKPDAALVPAGGLERPCQNLKTLTRRKLIKYNWINWKEGDDGMRSVWEKFCGWRVNGRRPRTGEPFGVWLRNLIKLKRIKRLKVLPRRAVVKMEKKFKLWKRQRRSNERRQTLKFNSVRLPFNLMEAF